MRLISIFIGIVCTLVLLGLMILTRLMSPSVEATPDLELREIELVEWVEPPPPPPEPESDAEETPPPPPMAMVPNLAPTDDPEAPTIPSTTEPIPMELGLEEFSLDSEVAELPVRRAPAPVRGPAKPSKPSRPSPPPPKKSSYSLSELDGKPRVIRVPSIRFPRALANKGVKQGKVVVEVAISPSGRCSLRRIISASSPELKAPATRIANGARFTPPTRNGQTVTAIMRWPLTIR